jgi:hypothetical protein
MLPPLLRVLLDEPRLLAEYASAYAALLKEDAAGWRVQQVRRLGYRLVVIVSVMLAILFGGVALMLFAAMGSGHWVLWVVPAVPALVAVVAGWQGRQALPSLPAFARVRSQLAQDRSLFERRKSHDELRSNELDA